MARTAPHLTTLALCANVAYSRTLCEICGTLIGAMLRVARVLRLGFGANFTSAPVLTGFKAGVGLVILLAQAPKLRPASFVSQQSQTVAGAEPVWTSVPVSVARVVSTLVAPSGAVTSGRSGRVSVTGP